MSEGKERILIVDDDLAFRVGTVALLADAHMTTSAAENGEQAKSLLAERQFDLVLSDLVMPGMNGIDLLQYIKALRPELPVIMVTGFASIDTAVQAMRLGARDYVTKPCANDELLLKIRRALDESTLRRELSMLRDEVRRVHAFGNIVGGHALMRDVYELVKLVAGTDVPALILGETGTGKELVAKAIHYNSSRREKPFVVVNCSAMAETLLESELFGHEKGAFTGAHQQRLGKFEEAEGGTVFLDELGDVPPQTQTKLLRVLQEQEIQRVGGNETIKVNNRIVAATHRDLQAMLSAGTFREDLYYRLNVFPITLPPLRERIEDIPALAEHFVKKHLELSQGRVLGISPSVFPAMVSYPWKGNIRELENLIKRAIIKTPGDTITAVDIPGAMEPAVSVQRLPEGPAGSGVPFKEYLSSITRHAEETYLRRMLETHNGNVNQIAKLMEIDRKTVYRKMAEFQIEPADFRPRSIAEDEGS
jgi:DNA-binding NtrC family response regulator